MFALKSEVKPMIAHGDEDITNGERSTGEEEKKELADQSTPELHDGWATNAHRWK